MDKIIRPQKHEILARISEIENLDLNYIEIEEIKNLLTLLFTGYFIRTPEFDPGLILYRGIPYTERPETISFLSYPPRELAKINRASRENEPFFYCATSRRVPLYELGVKPNDKLVVSKWRTAKNLLVNNVGYTDSNFEALNANRINQEWFPDGKTHPELLQEENIIVQNFLAKNFSQAISKNNTDLYKLTIAIAEKLFFDDNFDALIYPTIQMNANADNLAIKSAFVDSGGLIFIEVEFIEVTKIYDSNYKIQVLDWANSISDSGIIEWKGRLPRWKIREREDELKFIADEDGGVIAVDKDGNIVDPE